MSRNTQTIKVVLELEVELPERYDPLDLKCSLGYKNNPLRTDISLTSSDPEMGEVRTLAPHDILSAKVLGVRKA